MPTLAIDLTGKNGLAPSFQGDLNDTTAAPQRRYLGVEGQMADGIYNPLRLDGYVSPANNTFADLTGTITDEFISRTYSSSSDILYLAQNGIRLSSVAGLDGTSITSTSLLSGTSVLKDIEMYEINGQEALFYAYKYLDTSVTDSPSIRLGWLTTNTDTGAAQIDAEVFSELTVASTAAVSIASTKNAKLAQRFSTSDFELATFDVSGIKLALRMPYVGTTQNWSLKVGIQTDSAGLPSGTYVTNASVTMSPTLLPVGEFDYVYFTFSQIVTLTAATTYHIVVEPVVFGDLGANEGVDWLSSFGDLSLYTGGRTERNNGTAWQAIGPYDESFDFALILNRYDYAGFTVGNLNSNVDHITIGATGSGYTASGTNISFSVSSTAGLLNPCILVGIYVDGGDTVTAVTCDGVAMTLKVKATELQFADYLYWYYVTGVSGGSHTISVTTSGATVIAGMATTYYGVHQSNPIPTTDTTADDNSGSIAVPIAVDFNNIGTGALPIALSANNLTNGGGANTAGTNTVLRAQNASATFVGMYEYNAIVTTAATYTINVSGGGTPDNLALEGFLQAPDPTETETDVPPFIERDDNSVFLKKADNGFLYLFTNNRVHKFAGGIGDGNGGVFTSDVLSFPDYMECVDAVDTNSLMYIAVQSTETSTPDNRTFNADVMGVYVWDRVSTSASMRDFVPIYGARSIKKIFVNADGELRVITIGEDRFTEVRGIVNGRLSVLRRLGLSSYPVLRDSVDTLNNMTVWLGADGIIYALGQTANRQTEQLYKIGTISSEVSGTLTSGILVAGNESSGASLEGVFLSWADAGKTLTKWYPHGTGTINSVAQKGNQGNVYSLVKYLPMLANVKSIDLVCLPNGSAGDTTQVATVKLYANQSSTAWASKAITRNDIAKGYISFELNKNYVTALQLEVEWEATQTLGSNDFNPSYAIVEYEGTRTR